MVAVTRQTLGAWLIKGAGASPSTRALLRSGFSAAVTRCVRASYRTDLMAVGDPVLFWVSGDERGHPAGIYGQGRVTGPAVPDPTADPTSDDRPRTLVVPVRLEPVDPPVLRTELHSHPDLSTIEVLRMPAGSNPSFLTRGQLEALAEQWPEIVPEMTVD